MAMPGSHKGMRLQQKEKSFGLLLLLAFSAALFGVMAVQKLREKRVLNILLKEKEKELSEFQILLQKERDQAEEFEKRTGEMKDVIDTLSVQKRDLGGRIMEMESMVSSLTEERRAMVSVLEDRANEIKALREKEVEIRKKESDETSLREIVRKEEVAFEDPARRLGSSLQESRTHQENMASPDKKERSGNAEQNGRLSDEDYDENGVGQDNSRNNFRGQQQLVAGDDHGIAEAVNVGEGSGEERGNSASGMKFEVADEADMALAQPLRHRRVQLSGKRSKRWRVITRNRRKGRTNQQIVRRAREYQAQGGDAGEQLSTKTGTMNQGLGSTSFNDAGTSSRIQSKVEISSDKSADESRLQQASSEAVSNSVDVNRAKEENRYRDGDGENGERKPPVLRDSENQSENTDAREMTANDGNTMVGDEMTQMDNDPVKGENMDTLEMAVNDGKLPDRDEMVQAESANSVESTDDSLIEAEPEDTKQNQANNKQNSFQATPEEEEDEPEF